MTSTPARLHPTRSDPLQIVLIRACLHGRGACADFSLKSAALIKTNPTEWRAALIGQPRGSSVVLRGVRHARDQHDSLESSHSVPSERDRPGCHRDGRAAEKVGQRFEQHSREGVELHSEVLVDDGGSYTSSRLSAPAVNEAAMLLHSRDCTGGRRVLLLAEKHKLHRDGREVSVIEPINLTHCRTPTVGRLRHIRLLLCAMYDLCAARRGTPVLSQISGLLLAAGFAMVNLVAAVIQKFTDPFQKYGFQFKGGAILLKIYDHGFLHDTRS